MSRKALLYKSITEQVAVAEAGGLARDRAAVLLWFLRNVVGVGELEAYDYVCDGANDKGIDGLFLERGAGADSPDTLVIYQSKYTESANGRVGVTSIDRLAGAYYYFKSSSTLTDLLGSGLEPSLQRLIAKLDLTTALATDPHNLEVRLVVVTTGTLTGDAQKRVTALREAHGNRYVEVWDVNRLGQMADAAKSPDRLQDDICVQIAPDVLITGASPNRVAVLSVQASEVATWPGIDNRLLFALNVRLQLRANRVSKALDGAILRQHEHAYFLSCHNGLTVICDNFEQQRDSLLIKRPSVVNGAQSVLAFHRAADKGLLSEELQVFLKVVEVEGQPWLEKEVGRRSNTQTGVNPRNLMANHGTQLRLLHEFAESYPEISYETRPDVLSSSGEVIKNDAAAQLLCAIFNEWPWLAVKKTSLFEADLHPQIFSDRIRAHHVVFAERIKDAVQDQKDEFPERYRSSWLLTRLVACYLVGQVLRESSDVTDLLEASIEELEDVTLLNNLKKYAYVAAISLHERSEDLEGTDDFKKDFKNQRVLVSLAVAAKKAYRLTLRYPAS